MSEQTTPAPPDVSQVQAVKEHIAYHEAGHAAMAVFLGEQIEWVALAPNRDLVAGGRCVSRGAVPDTTTAKIQHLALYMSGVVAETLSPHQQTLCAESFERSDDYAALLRELTTSFPGTSLAARRQIRQAAHDYALFLLGRPAHAEAVRALATALLQRGELGHQEVVAIIIQAREQGEARERRAWARAWRWFWGSALLLVAADLAISAAVISVVNVWLWLAITAVSSLLVPLGAWEIAQRRRRGGKREEEALHETQSSRAWSLASYGLAALENKAEAHTAQPAQRKRARGQYDRHKRLPQRRRRASAAESPRQQRRWSS